MKEYNLVTVMDDSLDTSKPLKLFRASYDFDEGCIFLDSLDGLGEFDDGSKSSVCRGVCNKIKIALNTSELLTADVIVEKGERPSTLELLTVDYSFDLGKVVVIFQKGLAMFNKESREKICLSVIDELTTHADGFQKKVIVH